MTPRSVSVLFSFGVLAVAVPVAWALTPPAWIDEEYRQCMDQAIQHEMDQRIEAERAYGDGRVRDLETYRDALHSAWQVADEDQRRNALRDADRAYRDASRATKNVYDTRIREIRNESRDAQRECRNTQNDHERFVRNACTSTQDCTGNRVCSTERGVCDPSCPPGAEFCQQVCAGTCERSSRSSSSRSSRTSSSSSRPNGGGQPWDNYQTNGQVCRGSGECQTGYFCSTALGECASPCAPGVTCIQVCQGKCLLYPLSPTSSSSPTAGMPGVNCQPYRCADGREVPSCDASGNTVEYHQNPCYS